MLLEAELIGAGPGGARPAPLRLLGGLIAALVLGILFVWLLSGLIGR